MKQHCEEVTCSQAGKRGGARTKAKHGPEFYRAIGSKGGKATYKKHGPKHFENIGELGGLIHQQNRRKLKEESDV